MSGKMNLEIEAKLKIENPQQLDVIRQRLKTSGAIPLTCRIEHDTFFDLPDKSLAASDKALRLRLMLDENGKLVNCTLTFKGPRQAARYKTREEIELQLHRKYQHVEHMLRALGFGKVIQYQKRRESWRLDKCKVELDQLPQIGSFVEIEGPTDEAIGAAIEELQLTSAPRPAETYLEMVLEYLQGSGAEQLLFADETD